jgi:hypothetical protein
MSSDQILKNLLRFNDLKGDVNRLTKEIAQCMLQLFFSDMTDESVAVTPDKAALPIGDQAALETTREVDLIERGLLVEKLESVCDALEEVSGLSCQLFELTPKGEYVSSQFLFRSL